MRVKKKKRNYSKLLCLVAVAQFIFVIFLLIWTLKNSYSTDAFTYLIPSSAGLASIGVGFYFNKSKSENLSKNRIRYVYLKLFLQRKLSAETYLEIEEELNNIDSIIDNKLRLMLEESVDKENYGADY